jgi:hypothetical protein
MPQAESTQGTNNMFALLIGIDFYIPGELPGGIRYPKLGGCVRDINNIEDFLKNRLKIPQFNILKLTASVGVNSNPVEPEDRWPTYDNMVAAFQKLADTAKPGDHIYVHYSGHGGRAKTFAPEKKGEDGIDEALVPIDIHKSEGRYLRDIELAVICQRIVKKGIHLGVVLDCCHSGGAVRGIRGIEDLVAIRGISRVDYSPKSIESSVASHSDLLTTLSELTQSGTRNVSLTSGWLSEPTGYVLLAACRPTEYAYEYAFSGSERNGALTYWLLDAMNHCGPGLSTISLHERILAKVHSQFEQQTPQLQGEGRLSLFPGYQIALPPVAASVLEVDDNGKRVRLASVGQAFGNRKGAQFAIYPLCATNFADASKRVAIASIVEMGATASWAVITTAFSNALVEQGAPAILLDQGSLKLLHKVGLARRLDLKPEVDQETVLEAVASAISGSTWLALKTEADGDTLEYQVAINAESQFEIWDPSGKPISNLRPAIGIKEANAAFAVASRLEHLAKYDAIKQLENHSPTSPLAGKLHVELVGYQDDYEDGDKPEPRPFGNPGGAPFIQTGQWLFLRIRNNASSSLNVTLLDLQPDWGVSQAYPGGEGDWFVQLESGREIAIPLRAYLPPTYFEGRDVLKAFATVGAANFGRLALPALDQPTTRDPWTKGSATRGVPNPLEALLDAVSGDRSPAFATRHMTSASFPSADWTTSQVEIVVKGSPERSSP